MSDLLLCNVEIDAGKKIRFYKLDYRFTLQMPDGGERDKLSVW